MAITLHSPIYGPLKFYPPRKGGMMIPLYDDPVTTATLIGPEKGGALRTLIESTMPSPCSRLTLPGRDGRHHHVALFIAPSGRPCINTFAQPDLPSFTPPAQEYTPDVIGLTCYLRGLPQTRDNVVSVIGLDPSVYWEADWYQDPVNGQSRQLAKSGQTGSQIRPTSPIPVMLTAEDVSRRREAGNSLNAAAVSNAIAENRLMMPYLRAGQVYFPVYVENALRQRGIDPARLSPTTLMHIGFATSLTPYRTDGTPYRRPVKGVAFRLDGQSSWQIRTVTSFTASDVRYTSKDDGMIRFATMGPAFPFLLDDAVAKARAVKGTPLFITEGAFDALSIEAASCRTAAAASTQGCSNARYLADRASELAEAGIPVVLAFDSDAPGSKGAETLMDVLRNAGVHTYSMPAIPASFGDMNDLLIRDPETASALIAFVTEAVRAIEGGRLTAARLPSLFGKPVSVQDGIGRTVMRLAASEFSRNTFQKLTTVLQTL